MKKIEDMTDEELVEYLDTIMFIDLSERVRQIITELAVRLKKRLEQE